MTMYTGLMLCNDGRFIDIEIYLFHLFNLMRHKEILLDQIPDEYKKIFLDKGLIDKDAKETEFGKIARIS